MDEFLEQFLIEARELVQQAGDDLLALEDDPADAARLDGAFRAFHTLKGGAGIVDFAAMARAVHAAEDRLAQVRAGTAPVTATLIGDALACLGQVGLWLDRIEAAGDLPADAEAEADAVVARFEGAVAGGAAEPADTDGAWASRLLAERPDVAAKARTAIRFNPSPDSFFRGEDPLARMAELPGLLALAAAPTEAWPPLEDFDPYECRLVLTALSSAALADIAEVLRPVADQVELRALTPPVEATPASALSPPARALIEAQIALLGEAADEGLAGRIASAGRVAANVLQAEGRTADADALRPLSAAGEAGPLVAALRAMLAAVALAEPHAAPPEPAATPAPAREAPAQVLRVEVGRIDALVKLAGELTVAKNAVAHAARLAADGADPKALASLLADQHTALDRLVSALQRAVLDLRVLPLRQVFQRFARLVREMAGESGKPARLVIEGEDTEADKLIVEGLFEPLLHVVRNALDHGIERPEARRAAGKPPVATIHLRAARRGDRVIVEVEDDGGGVDIARVRALAAERGLATAEQLAALGEAEVVELIFQPGFSTTAEVTEISGRGVGMDAVRVAVGRLGGRVEIDSRAGEGTLAQFTLPFTVMMTRLMTVEAGGQNFGIPLDALVETVRVARERIVPVGAAHAFVLRDRTVPVIDLAASLGARQAPPDTDTVDLVIAAIGDHWTGLRVDRVGERMDVMLKPMQGLLAGLPGVAGATVLGDGRVLLVLDLEELIQWP